MKRFICDNCHKVFYRFPSERKGHRFIFCSRKCRANFIKGERNWNWKGKKKYICKNCGKVFFRLESYGKNLFCSTSCKSLFQTKGNKNPNWKGGIRISRGYRLIYQPNHPFRNKTRNDISEHRLILEKHLGRYLQPDECVHHINLNRSDNRLKNLYLMEYPQHRCYHRNLKRTYIKWGIKT